MQSLEVSFRGIEPEGERWRADVERREGGPKHFSLSVFMGSYLTNEMMLHCNFTAVTLLLGYI